MKDLFLDPFIFTTAERSTKYNQFHFVDTGNEYLVFCDRGAGENLETSIPWASSGLPQPGSQGSLAPFSFASSSFYSNSISFSKVIRTSSEGSAIWRKNDFFKVEALKLWSQSLQGFPLVLNTKGAGGNAHCS